MDDQTVIQPCCEAWEKAHKPGSDNEGYGPLIRIDQFRFDGQKTLHFLSIQIGFECRLPEVRFCPWCGHPKISMQAGGN